MSMIWLSNMTKTHGLLFRTYVPSLVACLEDADPAVRDTAKMTVVELFQNAPARAKTDLKKQMAAHDVRKSIVNAILTNIGLSSDQEHASSISRPASRAEALHQRPVSVMSSRSQHHSEVPHEDSEPVKRRPISSKSDQSRMISVPHGGAEELPDASIPQNSPPVGDDVEPLIIASAREIDDIVHDMIPWFDGRETEENWIARERSVCTLRRLTHGNAPHAFPAQFLGAMKSQLDSIFKVVNSLRTTMCTNGCLLIQDLAKICGPRIDPMVEIMMQNLVKLCAGMKKISSQNGNATVDAVIGNVTFTSRILQHVTSACQDKNVQLRLSAAGWLKTIINKQAHHRSSMEHGGGLDMVEKSIKKGLSDANPGVREVMRSTFWVFFGVWTEKADDILSNLDAKSRSLLEKDPSNPNIDHSASKGPAARKGPNRSALKEAIAARKKAQLKPANPMPPRPESAQSSFSEVKTSDLPPKSSTVRTVPTGASLSSLSSAPMRPAMKPRRPELARPATADPYASRKSTATESRSKAPSRLDSSPRTTRTKSSTPSSKPPSATRPRQKTDPVHVSTTKSKPKKLDISKSRSHDPHLAISRSRSNSNESTAHQYLERARDPSTPGPMDEPESPAPIQLESPPRPMMHQPVPALHKSVLSNDAITAPHDPHPTFEEPGAPEPPHDLVTEPSNHVHHPNNASNNMPKQPEPVIIYEDPILPALAEPEHHADIAIPDEPATTAEVPAEDEEPKPEDRDIIPIDAPESAPIPDDSQHSVSGLDHVPEADPTNIDTHNELPVPEEPETPKKPSPLVAHYSTTPADSTRIHGIPSLGPSDSAIANDNENTTPYNGVAPVPPANRSVSKSNALEELPTHEPSHRDNLQPRHVEAKQQSVEVDPSYRSWRKAEPTEKRSISPRSKDPANAREMISKGINRIRTKSMDIHGYRKLQKLIEYHDGIFTEQAMYNEMLIALLDELESPSTEKKQSSARSSDVKTQVLLAVRIMFAHNRDYFTVHCPKAMTALVKARRQYESNCHIVSGLDETADEIVAICEPSDVIDALLDLMWDEDKNEGGYRAITMGVSVSSKILRRLNGSHVRLSERIVDRLGKFANQNLTDAQADVRRQVTDLCVQLHTQIACEERFWRVLGSPRENSRNLLTYYIARKS
ncbi:hypothetical protein AWENTII_010121 [Aspergillus wentii]